MNDDFKSVSDKKIKTFFYKQGFYKMFKWIFVSLFILILCIVWAIYVYYTKPNRRYYAITQYGIVQELIPEKKLF